MLLSNKVIGFILKLRETITVTPYSHIIEYKPYPAFPLWKGLLDMTEIDQDILAAAAAAAAAQETANNAEGTSINAYGADAHNFIPYVMIPPTNQAGFGVPQFSTAVWLNQFCLLTGNQFEASIDVPLKLGRWYVELLMVKGSAAGNVRAYMDTDDLGLQLGYAASNTNALMSWLKTVSATGLHTVTLKIDGKETLSTGYNLAASLLVLRHEPE